MAMKGNLAAMLMLLLTAPAAAQTTNEVLLRMPEVLQYQVQKQKAATNGQLASFSAQPFRRAGFERKRVAKVLEDGDARHVWLYRVHANLEYDKERQPLYQLFKPANPTSITVIDHVAVGDTKCELVFWSRRYYHRFSHDLRRMGFEIRNSRTHTNVLEFRKPESSVGVDVIIFPEVYILQVVVL